MMRRLGWCVTAVGLMLGSAPALSQDAGWFVGAGIGYMKTDDTCPVTAAPGSNCEDEDTVWKIFGGYQFIPYLPEKTLDPALLDGFERDPVTAGSTVIDLRHLVSGPKRLHLADVDVQPPETPGWFGLRLDV